MSTTMPALLLKVQSIVCFCILKGLPLFIFAFLVVFFSGTRKMKIKTWEQNLSNERLWTKELEFRFLYPKKSLSYFASPKTG
jgi:type III secretory pathway component EscV